MRSGAPRLPEAVQMTYPAAFRLNAWAGVAVVAAVAARWLLRSPELSGWARAAVALLPLLPGGLYVRAIWVWMRALDELQRRIQFEAVCFAALAMLLGALTLDLLHVGGLVPGLHLGWEGYFAGTFFLWAAGLARANRNYR